MGVVNPYTGSLFGQNKKPVPDKIVNCAGCGAQLTQPKVCSHCGREHTESLFDPRRTAQPRIVAH